MPIHMNERMRGAVVEVLSNDPRVLFAYLYGSAAAQGEGEDVDIAVYAAEGIDPHELSADLKIEMYRKTGLPADVFDVRIINGLLEHGDLFALLYLKEVLTTNQVLTDKNTDLCTEFIYRYGLKYRECEGLIEEVLG